MGRREDAAARWKQTAAVAREELDQWREAHPSATFVEIEAAVDQRLDALRARAVQDLALATRAADLADKAAGAPVRGPTCGDRLVRQGTRRRRVLVRGGHPVDLDRDYAVCPACAVGLFPPG
ncbi:MAG: hypothetical protein HYX52_03370 [Chloroflexi bacterium]|nr:hypothetical protein [Chloroflexota bacterium]